MDTTEAEAATNRFKGRRVAFGWVVLLGVILAVACVFVVRTSRANEHTIKYWTETVDKRLDVCNPRNADLAVSSPPGKFGIIELNTGGNVCIYNANGTYAHQPYENRLESDERSDPNLFKGGPWVLTLARINSDTPSVIAAYRGVIRGPLNDWCRALNGFRPFSELIDEATVRGNKAAIATFFVKNEHQIFAQSPEAPKKVRADYALVKRALALATRAAPAPAAPSAPPTTKASPALAAANRIERACSYVGA